MLDVSWGGDLLSFSVSDCVEMEGFSLEGDFFFFFFCVVFFFFGRAPAAAQHCPHFHLYLNCAFLFSSTRPVTPVGLPGTMNSEIETLKSPGESFGPHFHI